MFEQYPCPRCLSEYLIQRSSSQLLVSEILCTDCALHIQLSVDEDTLEDLWKKYSKVYYPSPLIIRVRGPWIFNYSEFEVPFGSLLGIKQEHEEQFRPVAPPERLINYVRRSNYNDFCHDLMLYYIYKTSRRNYETDLKALKDPEYTAYVAHTMEIDYWLSKEVSEYKRLKLELYALWFRF